MDDTFSFFILNITLNSLLTFLTTLLLIEILIGIFRIKQGRCTSYLRMIPIFKLMLDPFLYDFSRWSYAKGVNPLNCAEGTRTLSAMFGYLDSTHEYLAFPLISGIQMTVPGDLTFTVADVIGHLLPLSLLRSFALLFAFTTTFLLIKQFLSSYFSIKQLQDLKKIQGKSGKKIRNPKLITYLKKFPLKILVSPDFHGSPFVLGLLSSTIVIPKRLSPILSQKEYEAVLAHEMEHIRYRDSLVRLILAMICSIFWWVPTKWLKERIEEGQEIGCDLQCKKYGVEPIDLATAICKSAKQISQDATPLFAYHLAKKHKIHKRMNLLLTSASLRFKKTRVFLIACAVLVAFFGVFLGRYWIF